MNPAFVADPKVQAIAEAYASDAVNLAAKMFNVKLDFEPKSVATVELLVAKARAQMAAAKPPDEAIWTVAKGFGSYVGEVLRKHHGGEWGTITDGANSYPGLRLKDGSLVWPWGKLHQRLVQGDEHNVLTYYKVLISTPQRTV